MVPTMTPLDICKILQKVVPKLVKRNWLTKLPSYFLYTFVVPPSNHLFMQYLHKICKGWNLTQECSIRKCILVQGVQILQYCDFYYECLWLSYPIPPTSGIKQVILLELGSIQKIICREHWKLDIIELGWYFTILFSNYVSISA